MIPAQPGKREVRQRADGAWLVYSFDPTLESSMQWQVIGTFKDRAPAFDFAFPKAAKARATG